MFDGLVPSLRVTASPLVADQLFGTDSDAWHCVLRLSRPATLHHRCFFLTMGSWHGLLGAIGRYVRGRVNEAKPTGDPFTSIEEQHATLRLEQVDVTS